MMFLETFGIVCLVLCGIIAVAWFFDKLFDAIGGEYGEKVGSAAVFFLVAFILTMFISAARWFIGVMS